MKRLLLPALAALVLVFAVLPLPIRAQSAVPGYITYQGKVSDAAGNLIGTGTPVNRKVRFRLYNDATSVLVANRLHTEEQTVTIANGEFNVLLGLGSAVAAETFVSSLDTVFTGAARYLGVTVDGGSGTFASDPEISPRQQIVTTPYAFRAKLAEGVVNQSVTAAMIANNAITATQLAPATITGTQLAGLTVATTNLADNSITTAKILDGTIATADLGAAQVTAAKLGADVGVWTPNGANVARASGNVGIGTASPAFPLSFGTSAGNTAIALYDDNISRFGLGIGNNHMRLHVGNSGQRFGFFNAPAGTEVFTILGNGNIGLGTPTPNFPISFGTTLGNTKIALWEGSGGTTAYGFGVQSGQLRLHVDTPSARFSFLNGTAGSEVATITGTGSIGVGIANPYGLLQLHTATADSRMSFTNSGTTSAAGRGLLVGIDSAGAFLWNAETNLPLRLASGGTERQLIYPDGRMGFNTGNGDVNLGYLFSTTTGYMMVLHSASGGWRYSFESNGTATKFGSSGWNVFSDARLKKNIAPLDGSLERLLKLRSVTFDWKNENQGHERQTGFIAQEVQQVFPDWVKTNPSGYLTVEHKGFEAHTVQALRELRTEKDAQIAQRDATIAALEQRVRDLETQTNTRLAAIERRLNAASLSANSPR